MVSNTHKIKYTSVRSPSNPPNVIEITPSEKWGDITFDVCGTGGLVCTDLTREAAEELITVLDLILGDNE